MGPIVTRLATDFDGRALVGQVNVLEQGTLTRSYGVSATPTFVYFKGGREVSRQVGQTTYEDLAGTLQALVAAP
jgi:thioredoxin 1